MNTLPSATERNRQAWQAMVAWGVFMVVVTALNGTLPFVLGVDLRPWTSSLLKAFLFHLIIYGALFLALPLWLAFGRSTARQPAFWLPLLLSAAAISLRPVVAWLPVLSLPALAYLHRRFDLARVGVRPGPWPADAVAIVCLGLLGAVPALLAPHAAGLQLQPALAAGLDRLMANPAATVENLFYFGFLAERLSYKLGRWWTAPLIGAMYTAHEMSNPEYWYAGRPFALIFMGITLTAAVYLWRRNVTAVWLGDSLGRFLSRL